MDLFVKQFPQLSRGIASDIADALANANSVNPNLGITDLITKLRAYNTDLATFEPAIQSEGLISSGMLNSFYTSVLSDLFVLCGKLKEIELTNKTIEETIKAKVDNLDNIIKELSSRYRELKYLDDHIYSLEVFDQKLATNIAAEDATRFSEVDSTLELGVVKAAIVDKPDSISVKFLGNVKTFGLPEFQKEYIFDESYFSAWYQIASKLEDRTSFIDILSDGVEVALAATSQGLSQNSSDSRGTFTKIPINNSVFTIGDKITIGDPRSKFKEEIEVIGVSGLTLEVQVIPPYPNPPHQCTHQHFGHEPIRKGHNLRQVKGVVAIVELSYSYLQQFNKVRIYPFATKPMKLMGIQYFESAKWNPISETTLLLDSEKSVSFPRVITNKLRLLLCQENSRFARYTVTATDANADIAWAKIYETEFKVQAQAIEDKLKTFDKNQQVRAKLDGYRAFLARQNDFANVEKNNTQLISSATEETNAIINTVKEFTGTNTDNVGTVVKQFMYDLGLAEVEFSLTEYKPFSNYVGELETPKRNFDLVDLLAEEVHQPEHTTSVIHKIILADGQTLGLPNRAILDSNGLVKVRNEVLSIDDNGYAWLSFVPMQPVSVHRYNPLDTKKLVPSSHVNFSANPRLIYIPSAKGIIRNKDIFMVLEYTLRDPDIYIKSNVVSVETIDRLKGTNTDRVVYTMKAPYLEPSIVNSRYTSSFTPYFKRIKYRTAWKYVNYDELATEISGFPSCGTVVDNIYYGPVGNTNVLRSAALENLLLNIFTTQSVDPIIALDRFFNKYGNKKLEKNVTYEPLIVTVDGKEAYNLTEYGQYYDTGLIDGVDLTNQYKHWEDMIMFMDVVPETTDIKVVYRYKETTLQYMAELNNNLKSNFWVTPKLKSILLATRIK